MIREPPVLAETFSLGSTMGLFESKLGYNFAARAKDKRKSVRKPQNADAWIRSDGTFAVRPCKVIDLSNSGIRISIDGADRLMGAFVFMAARGSSSGRRARVKWRRGAQIGAEFV